MDKDTQIKILQDVIQIESVLGKESEVADYLEKLLNDAGIETKRITYAPGRDNLIASLKGDGEGPVLGFSGHMDVVPVGDVKWEHDPFGAEITPDGNMHGRGTSDMKAGLVALVLAMIELKNSGTKFNGEIRLIATVGEETSGIGAEQLVGLGEADDLDALIIAEPATNNINIAHKGALWPKITTYGKTAHGSAPHLGVNAVDHMIELVKGIKENLDMSDHMDKTIGKPTMSLNKFEGGKATNVIPDTCVAEFDIRTVASQNHEDIKKVIDDQINKLSKEIPDFKADVEYINDLFAVATDSEDPFVKLALNVADETFGTKTELDGLSAYTDASQFVKAKKSFPIIIYGPGSIARAHQPNEYVEVDEYLGFIDCFTNIAKAYLA